MRQLLAALAVLAATSAQAAQTSPFQRALAESRAEVLEQRSAVEGLSASVMVQWSWTVLTVYKGRRDGRPFWWVRRVRGLTLPKARKATTAWASSDSCTALEDRLSALQQVPAPTPPGPEDDRRPRQFSMLVDGGDYRLWTGTASYPRPTTLGRLARGGLEISGDADSPLAAWFKASDAALAGCWRSAPPSFR